MLPSGSNSKDTNLFLDQAQQSEDIEIIQEQSQQPKRMKTEQDVETQEPAPLRYVADMQLRQNLLRKKCIS